MSPSVVSRDWNQARGSSLAIGPSPGLRLDGGALQAAKFLEPNLRTDTGQDCGEVRSVLRGNVARTPRVDYVPRPP